MSRLCVNAAFICELQVGTPFRLTLRRPIFIKIGLQSRCYPFLGEQHYDTGAAPKADPNGYRSSRCEHYGMKVGLSAKHS